MATLLGSVLFLHYLFLYRPEKVPHTFLPGSGLTAFKIFSEYGLIACYLLAAMLFLLQLPRERRYNTTGLFAVSMLMAMSELFFTLYANVTDLYNLMGHVYKIIAYGFLYRALFVESVETPWQQLINSQKKLAATINALPDLLFELDENGVYLNISAYEPTRLLAPPQEKIGKNMRDFLSPEAVETIVDGMRHARQNGVSRGHRITVELPEGPRHYLISISAHRSKHSDPFHYLLLAHDETDAVIQQQMLGHQAKLNEVLLTITQEAIGRDEGGILLYAAEQARAITASHGCCVYLVDRQKQYFEVGGCARDLPKSVIDTLLAHGRETKQTLHLQNPASVKATLGIPEGVERMLSVPVVEDGEVTLIVNVGNKHTPFTATDEENLKVLANSVWQLVRRKRQDEDIQTLSTALSQSPHAVVITRLDRSIEYVNDAFVRATGYQPEEVIGRNADMLKGESFTREMLADLWHTIEVNQLWQGEMLTRRKDGSEFFARVIIYPVRDAQGTIYRYISHREDISAEKAAAERIQQLSNYDQLTQLPNRALLKKRCKYLLESARINHEPLALLWLDLDNFKVINDVLGHAVGDQMLLETANRVSACVREQDVVARQSGDGFVIVLPGADQDVAALQANEILQRVSTPMLLNDQEMSTSVSIGISIYPNDGQSLETLLMCAEAAMYQVKQQGRNNFRFYSPDMQDHTSRSLAISNGLKHALANNEFFLVYQPQYCLHRKRMIGAEVLLRWNSEKFGFISPAEFIPMAESNGMIVMIGEWVMRTAAKQLYQWHQQGMTDLVLAINLSFTQFKQPQLVETLTTIVREEGLEPTNFELELTEAVASENPDEARATMDRLTEAGFKLSIDDFGTGYSSMSYLKQFSVNKLKIDQSFVRELEKNKDDLSIVTAISQLAHSLDMVAIAEGVETQEQWDLLQSHGCDEIQGYFYSRPIPANEFELFTKASRNVVH